MKLGLLSTILDNRNFDDVVRFVSKCGMDCIEVACWPSGKKDRRYSGVTHINVSELNDKSKKEILGCCKEYHVSISSLAYYDNPLDPDLDKRKQCIEHLYKVIDASVMLDVNLVSTFIGRNPKRSFNENLEDVFSVWKPILDYAEKKNVKIAIENCPMLFTDDEWPGGQNMMTSPAHWRIIFKLLDSPNLGLNYDPSHFIWQKMDYIRPIYEFKDKIFHVHYKDLKLYDEKLDDVGTLATPLQYMEPKIPGLGDVNWAKFVSALRDIRYKYYSVIEVEDKAFENSEADIENAIFLSLRYLRNYII